MGEVDTYARGVLLRTGSHDVIVLINRAMFLKDLQVSHCLRQKGLLTLTGAARERGLLFFQAERVWADSIQIRFSG